jgi:phosphoribosyl-AMP cyclohydrolase
VNKESNFNGKGKTLMKAKAQIKSLVNKLKYGIDGLIPAVVQDYKDNSVLMVAYMNKNSVLETLRTGNATYWSRSRQKYWIKGEESGNFQKVKAMFIDCDLDTIVIKVRQIGGAACHTGYRSCFFTRIFPAAGAKPAVVGKKVFDPEKRYKK